MNKLTKRVARQINDTDRLTEFEFYKLKGVIAVFENASEDEIFAAQHADCDDCLSDAISDLVKYIKGGSRE